MSRQSFALIGTLSAAVALTGCASYTRGIRADDSLSSDAAYLYGRFFIKAESHALAMDGHQSMGFTMVCADRSAYTIRFSNKPGVQVIKIKPSRCWLAEIVYTDGDGVIRQRARPRPSWVRSEEFAAGRAYYLGDYFARAQFDFAYRVLYTEYHLSWDMSSVDDRYESTSDEMHGAYPALAPLPIEDRRLAPKPPTPNHRPAQPVLSPERIAHIAPFTKRRFATPTECEAACPTGECLPYRGELGPAMTCITGCRADSDCPEGLACNCAKSQSADCHPIASTPQDAMEGICLSVEATGQRR